MVVWRVHHAGSQLVDLAGRKILDRAGALEHQYRLEMVLIVHRQFLAGEHRRDVEREAHIVVLEQQAGADPAVRSEEHTSELQSLMRISYAVFCLKKKQTTTENHKTTIFIE